MFARRTCRLAGRICACLAATTTYLVVAGSSRADAVTLGPVQAIAPASPFPGGCPPDSGEPGTQGAQYEPYMAIDPGDPSRLAAAWIQDGGLDIVSAFSRDAGRSWTRALLGGVSHCTGGNTGGAVNPWLSFGPDRALYAVALGADIDSLYPLTNAKSQVTLNLSSDAGAGWSPAQPIQPRDGSYYDKPTITADPNTPGRAYAVWGKRSGPSGTSGITQFSVTADRGRSWSAPATIYDPGPAPYPQWPHGDVITVLPDGSLLDVFGLMNNSPFVAPGASLPDAIMAMRSTGGGRTWSSPTKIADVPSRLVDDDDSSNTRLITLPIPSVAAAPGGTVYAAWHENPTATGGRILVSRSTDHGRTWSAASTVEAPGAQAFLPAIAATPSGELGLLFYDTRHDTPNDGKLTTDLWFAHSDDHGNTWQQTHVAGPFDALTAPSFFNLGHLMGDSIDLAPAPNGFDAVFTLARPLARAGPTTAFFSHIQLAAPAPGPAAPPLLTVPRQRSCQSRRQLTIHLHVRRGERITSILIRINGKRAARRHPRRASARIDLRGLPRGRVTIRVSARTSRGRTIRLSRRYRTCAPRR